VDAGDQRLIQRARQGDRSAFAELVDKYRNRIFGYLLRMVGNREDALDLAQETFLRVFSSLDSFNPDRPFKPWLYRIATNLAIDYLRRRRDVVSLDAPLHNQEGWHLQLADEAPGPVERQEQAELAEYLARLVSQLPENYRSAILLRHGHDLTYQQMAEILGVPVSTVKTRLFRARERLRQELMKQRDHWEAYSQ
jgi:RNA polymerase sigma-70 factor (ECF subfamily)